MESRKDLEAFALQAFVNVVANIVGAIVLLAFCWNYWVLEAYFFALFWSVVASIPLFQVKKFLINRSVALIAKRENGGEGRSYAVLSILQPYESFGDFVWRDIPSVFRLLLRFSHFFFIRPIELLFEVETEEASKPYFGILLRACGVHLFWQFYQSESSGWTTLLVLALVVSAYCLVVAARLVGWIVLPLLRGLCQARQSLEVSSQEGKHLRKTPGGLLRPLKLRFTAFFLNNIHCIVSVLIIVFFLIVSLSLLGFFSWMLVRETIFIWRTGRAVIHSNQFIQDAVEQIQPGIQSLTMLVGNHSNLGTQVQAGYEHVLVWMEENIQDYHVVKYFFYDIWAEENSTSNASSTNSSADILQLQFFVDPGMAGTCRTGPQAGYSAGYGSCSGSGMSQVATQSTSSLVQLQFPNVTALMRGLARGNFSAVRLLPSAISELSESLRRRNSTSSQAGDGAEEDLRLRLQDIIETMLLGLKAGGDSLFRLATLAVVIVATTIQGTFDLVLQVVVFLTALFYLLYSRISVLEYVGEVLQVIDPSQAVFRLCERVIRAILQSAMKMSVFHALFTWILFSYYKLPVVYVPTALSAVIALVPIFSPVWGISIWASVYLWLHDETFSAIWVLILNLAVWWQISTAIYAEIPESNPWLTGLSVVLGISHFGPKGVVLGPLVASVPLLCFDLVQYFNENQEDNNFTTGRSSSFLSTGSVRLAASKTLSGGTKRLGTKKLQKLQKLGTGPESVSIKRLVEKSDHAGILMKVLSPSPSHMRRERRARRKQSTDDSFSPRIFDASRDASPEVPDDDQILGRERSGMSTGTTLFEEDRSGLCLYEYAEEDNQQKTANFKSQSEESCQTPTGNQRGRSPGSSPKSDSVTFEAKKESSPTSKLSCSPKLPPKIPETPKSSKKSSGKGGSKKESSKKEKNR